MKPFDKLSEEILDENPWWTYKHDTFVLPDGVSIGNYYYGQTSGSVIIIPRLESGKYVLVDEYKYLMEDYRYCFPVGGLKEGEDPKVGAERELHEETGMTCSELVSLGSFEPNGGLMKEECFLFFATGLQKGNAHLDETEKLTTVEMSTAEIEESIRRGELQDGFALSAWLIYTLKHKG